MVADIVLSSSSRFYSLVIELRDELMDRGLSVLTPDLEFVTKTVTASEKMALTTNFFEKIERSNVFCVVTDSTGYVGRSVSMEVGFAFAKGKPLVCLQRIEDPAIGGLCTHLPSLQALVECATARSGQAQKSGNS
jgi:nucleoside 2-deoxyribosyltransferase